MEVRRFHVVVIGSGPGGSSAALALARAGLSVAVVDEREFGGTCPNRGCDPKKLLRVGAELANRSKALAREGITEPIAIDWERLVAFKRRMVNQVPGLVEASMSKVGISTFHARASFIDPHTISVGDIKLSAERIIIATGAHERELTFPGAEHLATSEDVLNFDTLPEHALFVGGGYVSFELAHLLNACGVSCTIIHRDERPLPDFDPILVRKLIESSREDGITIVLGTEAVGVDPVDGGYHVHAVSGNEHHTYETDIAIHGAGREANIASLNLSLAGVHATAKGITVDRYLRASEHIYAIGDCARAGPALTPLAQHHGHAVAETLLGRPTIFTADIVPHALFTFPEIASVGMSEHEAKAEGIDVRIENHETSSWFSSMRIGQRHSGARIIIDRSSDLVIGAHLLGEGSEELINLFALAIREGISAGMLKNGIYSFPTHSSDIPSLL
jgi:glutathione reductase (NADPH)